MKHTSKQIFKKGKQEGWCISYTGIQDATHNIFELQRIDDDGKFENDDEAIKHVVNQAIKDTKSVHASAIKFLVKESPNEVDSIVRTAIDKDTFSLMLNKLKVKL